MKPALKILALLSALIPAQAGAGFASGEKSLPDFTLNSKRAASIYKYNEDRVPAVPAPTDTGYYARYGVGAARMESAVTVVVRDGAGRADIVFPRAAAPERASGYRASLFIKLEGEKTPVLSWATVFCSGGRYLGYKGASLEMPRGAGADFAIKDETLALGPLKVRLLRTHPWMAGGDELDGLCGPRLPKKLRGYTVKALPAEAGGLSFKYDKTRNSLSVTWEK